MSNIAVSLTSFILGIECIILSGLLLNTKTASSTKYLIFVIFLGIALASLTNSVVQGFFTEESFTRQLLWKSVLCIVGVVACFLYSASLTILSPARFRYGQILILLSFIAYLAIVFYYPHFSVAIGYYYFAALLLFFALLSAYRQTKHRQIRYGIYAVILVSLAPLFQQSFLEVGNITGNVVYNLFMIIGIYFCYVALIAVLQKHSKEGFRDVYVNDLHSRLNETVVSKVIYAEKGIPFNKIIEKASLSNKSLSICGYRHAMGGQQFAEKSILLDMHHYNRVLDFNKEKGTIKCQAGITWPTLYTFLQKKQKRDKICWTFSQKQTGADYLTLGGALSANVHGRGLSLKPFVQDVLSFNLIDAKGQPHAVSRTNNQALFQLAIGGYGLFGLVTEIEMQLVKRQIVQRRVEVISIDDLPMKFAERIDKGFIYGDFQFKTNEKSDDYLKVGVFSCYQPVEGPLPHKENRFLQSDDWNRLLLLAHIDKENAFKRYSDYYLTTDGQCYWSDLHQMSFYNDKYVEYLHSFLPAFREGSLMITEVYVPLDKIAQFMKNVANDPNLREMNVVYGTVRLIKKDDETFMPWAKEDFACIIFNLHVPHHMTGFQFAGDYFSGLIDHALAFDGSFYLTYHRFARKDQILKAYPQFPEFLALKLKYDPQELFQSTWYRYYKRMFSKD